MRLKKTKKPLVFSMIATLVGALLAVWIVNSNPTRVYAGSYMSPTHIGTPGYIDAATLGIKGCTPTTLRFNDNNSGAPKGDYYFASEPLSIYSFASGGTGSPEKNGNLILYSWSSQTYDNGYLMMDWSDLASYVQAFDGDLTWVQSQLQNNQTTVSDPQSGATLSVVNLSDIASQSGAKWSPTTSNQTSGGRITATYMVQKSDPPKGSVTTDKTNYNIGDTVKISLDAQIATFNTAWHRVAVRVLGPNGYSKWIVGTNSDFRDNMQALPGGSSAPYGSTTFNDYKHSGADVPALNFSTSGLAAGGYTVQYYLRDNLNRPAQTYPYTASFQLGSGGPPAPGGGTGPSITLSANPQLLYTGNPTTLTASASNVPKGDSITIVDVTKGITVGTSGTDATSYTTQYTSNVDGTDYFVTYLGSDATSNQVDVTWKYPLSITPLSAAVVHTPHWLDNIQTWNRNYPSQERSLGLFWAGEELCFQVQHNPRWTGYWDVQSATVQVNGLKYDDYAMTHLNPPTSINLNLSYNPTTGYVEGHTDPSLSTVYQYLLDGQTYTAYFTVVTNGINGPQTQYATATFTISGKWTDFWKDTQVY